MTVSGSTDFSLTRDQIITQAREYIGAIPVGGTPTSAELASDGITLNMMLKAWQMEGLALWKNTAVTLYLEKDKQVYTLGSSGDHCSSSVVETEIRVAGSSGDTTIEVDSTTGMTTGDYCGIEIGDDEDLQWTTLTITDSDTIEIGDALTDDIAVDAKVFTYTSKIPNPLNLYDMRYYSESGSYETPISLMTSHEYLNFSDKTQSGQITQAYYKSNGDSGLLLYVYLVADTEIDKILMTARMPFFDFDASDDTADAPAEILETIVLNLATKLYYKYRPDLPDYHMAALRKDARVSKEILKGYDTEEASIYLYGNIER